MTEEFIPFDPAEALDRKEVIELFLESAFASGDAEYITIARNIAARAEKIHNLAESTERLPASLHKTKPAV